MGYRKTTTGECENCGRVLYANTSRDKGICGVCAREMEPENRMNNWPKPKYLGG